MSRVSCLVSRVACRVSRVACLGSRVSGLLSPTLLLASWCLGGSRTPTPKNNIDGKSLTIEQSEVIMSLLGPVSYTHLDVYKRQALDQAITAARVGGATPATYAGLANWDRGPTATFINSQKGDMNTGAGLYLSLIHI